MRIEAEAALGDCVDILVGFPFKSNQYSDDVDDIALLRGDNIAQGSLRWSGVKRWPTRLAAAHSDYLLQAGDVVLAMDRPWIEAGLKYAVVSERDTPALLVQRVACLRANSELDQGFLRYLIGSREFTLHVLGVQTGTAVPHISPTQIREFRFRVPPIAEQRAIAEVLGALDDKIEANQRTATLCRALAAALLGETLQSAERRGELRYVRLENIAEVNRSQVKPGTGVIKYLDISSVKDGTATEPLELDWSDAPSRARRLVEDGDTVWSTVRPNRRSHYLALDPPQELVISTGFAVLSPTAIGPSLLFGLTDRPEFETYLVSVAEGSAYPAVSARRFAEAVLPLPSEAASNEYEVKTMPLRLLAARSELENRVLGELRNALLPKLLAGAIRVAEAEVLVGVSA